MLLLLHAGTPVTALPRFNLAHTRRTNVLENGLRRQPKNGRPLDSEMGSPRPSAAAAAQAARHREVTTAEKVYKAAVKKANKAGAAPSAEDAQREQRQRESNRGLMAKHVQPRRHKSSMAKHMQPRRHKSSMAKHVQPRRHKSNMAKHVLPKRHKSSMAKHVQPRRHKSSMAKHVQLRRHKSSMAKHVQSRRQRSMGNGGSRMRVSKHKDVQLTTATTPNSSLTGRRGTAGLAGCLTSPTCR